MGTKCALIVDDSRLAREVLSGMLERHDLRVETAESAEAALSFLSTQRPDVIFMDHMMPGMDGFEAVKAIKQNPATATIPVMMYTSQSGELYVGQARALGAVGVLPKQIKPVEVAGVLQSLHLIPGSDGAQVRLADEPRTLPGAEVVMQPADWSDLHRWLEEMLNEHGRALRADLETSVSRILGERGGAPDQGVPGGGARSPGFWPYGALIATLAAVSAVFFALHLDAQARWRDVASQNLGLMSALESRRVAESGLTMDAGGGMRAGDGLATSPAELASAIEWSINQSATFPPDGIPFDDARAQSVADLVARLRSLGFSGVIRLEGHVGDFCMVRAGETGFVPAADDLPVTRCDRVGYSPEEARAQASRQSVAFANALAELELADGAVRVEIDARGNAQPREPYPDVGASTLAGEWNRAARANQRVETRLLPENGPVGGSPP